MFIFVHHRFSNCVPFLYLLDLFCTGLIFVSIDVANHVLLLMSVGVVG